MIGSDNVLPNNCRLDWPNKVVDELTLALSTRESKKVIHILVIGVVANMLVARHLLFQIYIYKNIITSPI